MRSNQFSEVYLFSKKNVVSFFSFQYLCRPEKLDHIRLFMIIPGFYLSENKRGNEKTIFIGVRRG